MNDDGLPDIGAILSARTALDAATESGDPAELARATAAETAGEEAVRRKVIEARGLADAEAAAAAWTGQVDGATRYLLSVSKHLRVAAMLLEALMHTWGWRGLSAGAALYRRLTAEPAGNVRPPAVAGKRGDRHRFLLNQTQLVPRLPGPALGVWFVPMFTAGDKVVRRRELESIEQAPLDPQTQQALDGWDGGAWLAEAGAAADEVKQLVAAIEADAGQGGDVPPELERLDNFLKDIVD